MANRRLFVFNVSLLCFTALVTAAPSVAQDPTATPTAQAIGTSTPPTPSPSIGMPTETPTAQAIGTSTPPTPSPSIGMPTATPTAQAIGTSTPPSPSPSIGMPTATATAAVPPPVISSGANADSTAVSGEAAPNQTPGNNCISIVLCDPAGCGGPQDQVIGTGDVSAQGFFTVVVMPPLVAGTRIYVRDTCTQQSGDPLLISLGTVVPAASPGVVAVLALVLATVAVRAIRRRRA